MQGKPTVDWMLRTACFAATVGLLSACAPEVGSDAWCEKMEDTPKGEWSANEATSFAKHCVLGIKPDK
jgi:hypothetical protein